MRLEISGLNIRTAHVEPEDLLPRFPAQESTIRSAYMSDELWLPYCYDAAAGCWMFLLFDELCFAPRHGRNDDFVDSMGLHLDEAGAVDFGSIDADDAARCQEIHEALDLYVIERVS